MPVDLWTSAAFIDEATGWVAAAATTEGLRLTGEWEQPHARAWSSAIRFESDGGRLWFKVNGPGTRHEAGLTGTLATVLPDLVPQVLAVDIERGWSLMHDAGPVMRSLAEPDALWERWHTVIADYGQAQRAMAGHLDAMRAAGVAEVSPRTIPDQARRLLDELSARAVEDGGLDEDQAVRLDALMPDLEAWCLELDDSGLGLTVNHDDLHSSNICWGDVGPRIIDWGDAVLGHPFGSMLATLNSIAWHAGVEVDADPRVLRVRDVYLDQFADTGSHEDRVRWTALARRTGCVSKALSYIQAFEGEERSAQEAEDWPVRGWLLELLEENG